MAGACRYDRDMLSADDMISIIDFRDPFTPQSDNRPGDGAEYHTTVEFDRRCDPALIVRRSAATPARG